MEVILDQNILNKSCARELRWTAQTEVPLFGAHFCYQFKDSSKKKHQAPCRFFASKIDPLQASVN